MTRDEAKKIVRLMMVFFPNYDPQKNGTSLSEAVNAWEVGMSDLPYQVVEDGLVVWANSNHKFAPIVGELRNLILGIANPDDDLDEMKAWFMVVKAVSNSIYNAEPEFERLPSIVQETVGGPNMLYKWATTDEATFNTVIQSNFMRSFRAVKARKAEERAIPAAIRQRIKTTLAQLEVNTKPRLNQTETKPEPRLNQTET